MYKYTYLFPFSNRSLPSFIFDNDKTASANFAWRDENLGIDA